MIMKDRILSKLSQVENHPNELLKAVAHRPFPIPQNRPWVMAQSWQQLLFAHYRVAVDTIRPMMRAKSDAEFERLKAGFRAGIPSTDPVDSDAARALFALMAELGGKDLVGEATELPDGVFYAGE